MGINVLSATLLCFRSAHKIVLILPFFPSLFIQWGLTWILLLKSRNSKYSVLLYSLISFKAEAKPLASYVVFRRSWTAKADKCLLSQGKHTWVGARKRSTVCSSTVVSKKTATDSNACKAPLLFLTAYIFFKLYLVISIFTQIAHIPTKNG